MLPPNFENDIDKICQMNFEISHVGEATLRSPVASTGLNLVSDSEKICYFADPAINEKLRKEKKNIPAFTLAGPRKMIFHDPTWSRVGIMTCGGLCPGLNDVIKSLVNTLWYLYKVDAIFGIRYGYQGLAPDSGLKPIELTPDVVDSIHLEGGTILGSSRGAQSPEEMVKTLDRLHINILFTIGGDGTQRGAHAIAMEAKKRNYPLSVVGVPKTIDNDLNFMDRTFGFESAVQATVPIISSAHNEARGAYNGIGLVKLMGRDSGFIAASASLANSVVNCCLVPEVPFDLNGPKGFLKGLENRLSQKHHAVIVVAEGAGQNLMGGEHQTDKSGNVLHNDIGIFLRDEIKNYFKKKNWDFTVKYFDPSYEIRSQQANANDSIFCLHLAQNAAHAAMAGMTDVLVANWQGYFTYVPIELATSSRRKIDPNGPLWHSVLLTTRQVLYF